MSKEIWIYGHWLSCNMGDRHQARGLVQYLQSSIPISSLIFVNFSKDVKPMSILLDGITYPVYGPEDVQDRSPQLIILVTGSIDYQAKFIPWIDQQTKKETLDEVIIWGGFSHGRREGIYRDGLDLFFNPKVTFWSRSWRDAEMYEEWFGRPSRLAGDPMAYWVLDHQKEEGNEETVVIPSIYAWQYSPEKWDQLTQDADRVISIDNVADYALKAKIPHLEFINDPAQLVPILKKAKRVISGRLHGGLLSALIKVPTIMVITDNALPGEGTYKFEAVARTGSGFEKPLCDAIPIKDLIGVNDRISPDKFHVEEYCNFTKRSLSLLREKIEKIIQQN